MFYSYLRWKDVWRNRSYKIMLSKRLSRVSACSLWGKRLSCSCRKLRKKEWVRLKPHGLIMKTHKHQHIASTKPCLRVQSASSPQQAQPPLRPRVGDKWADSATVVAVFPNKCNSCSTSPKLWFSTLPNSNRTVINAQHNT